MNYRNKPELQDRLAAEYVLGTLRGDARLRFQAWMRADAALRRAVQEWESRLGPMAAAVPAVAPPKRVWEATLARVSAGHPAAASAGSKQSFWESLAFWRNWGLIATGCAAALVGALALRAPQVVEVQRTVEVPSNRMQPSYIAVLHATDSTGEKMAFLAYAARNSDELWVKRLDLPPEPHQHSYELWGLPGKAGEPPTSLGVIPAGDKGTIKLAAAADQSLKDFPALAISVEPEGGSKSGLPTGPVLAKGDCMKFW